MKKSKTKNAIKALVKECLIEVLAEGLVGSNSVTVNETRQLRGAIHEAGDRSQQRKIAEMSLSEGTYTTTSTRSSRANSYLDNLKMSVDGHMSSNNETLSAAKNAAKNLTKDPIMADILADTAMTTLQEQREGRNPASPSIALQGDQAAKVVDQSMPEELFGGSSQKWANLAFAPSIRK